MATTNFSALGLEEKIVWARELWAAARNASFVMQFTGKGPNSMIQRITELTKSEKGARAIITLVADLTGDGVMGDSTMENNEEAIKAHDTEIRIDQLRNANRLEGRMADQKSVVSFRETSKDVLAYWLADRIDQLGFLTLSSVNVTQNTNGTVRAVRPSGQNFSDLEFVESAPAATVNRYYNWDVSALGFIAGNTATIEALDLISYRALVELKALAKTQYIRGIKGAGGMEYYHIFLHPKCMAKLKLDGDYLASLQNAGPRAGSNPIFSGAVVTVDGLVIHEHRHSINTTGAVSGTAKWGSGANVEGNAVLFCGAQAMAIADIGLPYWDEETFDYGNQHGISVGKIFGMLKPQFKSIYDGTDVTADRDFGVIRVNFAM
jgi:N4-gp56 family major capsid protein